jgi:hypothetical protein
LLHEIQEVARSGVFGRRLEDYTNLPGGLEGCGAEGAIRWCAADATTQEFWV